MKASTIEREIKVVETIIEQLNRCLAIYHQEKMMVEFKNTLVDIQKCKKELNRLQLLKTTNTTTDVPNVDAEGETIDHATDFRPRKNVL